MTAGNRNQGPHSAELKSTSVSQPPPDVLPLASSKHSYGAGDCIGGKYRLESLLGRGGMGEVWTASNETLAVQRAVKLIRSEADSRENTDRLLHEARAAARLADPAIVRVFDFGKTQFGDPFLVMEVLRGEDLASALRRKERLSATRAIRILLPVIRALGLAHLHGIVHRDLKPENIFLTKSADGRIQPKLLDFGIAKLKDIRSLRLTMDGSVMGSPLYMAPEQARGEDVDERADIWALCVVLYEIITGQPPFLGETRSEVFTAATRSTPKSLVDMGMGDATLWKLLLKGLSKKPDNRFQSMRELGQAFAGWLQTQKVSDDITGASLDAAWFRESPQSFLSSTMPPGRPSLATIARVPGPGRKPANLSAGPSLPTLSPSPDAAVVAMVLSEPSSSSRVPWPRWFRTTRQRLAVSVSIVVLATLPWMMGTDETISGPNSTPNASARAEPPILSAQPPGDDGTEESSDLDTVSPPIVLDMVETSDAAAPPLEAPDLTGESIKAVDTAPRKEVKDSSGASKKSVRAARHRARKKRRSRLMDPFQ